MCKTSIKKMKLLFRIIKEELNKRRNIPNYRQEDSNTVNSLIVLGQRLFGAERDKMISGMEYRALK